MLRGMNSQLAKSKFLYLCSKLCELNYQYPLSKSNLKSMEIKLNVTYDPQIEIAKGLFI